MFYTIVANDNLDLITTVKPALRQRETNAHTLRFLLPPTHVKDDTLHNINEFIVVAKYLTPDDVSHVEVLQLQDMPYKDKLDYRLEVDTGMTAKAGIINLHLSFLNTEVLDDGTVTECVFHSGYTTIEIEPVKEIIFIPDTSLEAIDQILLSMDSKVALVEHMLKEVQEDVEEMQEDIKEVSETTASDIEVIDGQIWLVTKDPETGETIKIGDPIENARPMWEEM